VRLTLRVLLAESGFTETGVTLRSLCAEQGNALELLFVSRRSNLSLAPRTYCPDVALLDLALFQPDPPGAVSVLHEAELSSSHYLQKPYSPTALGRVIRQRLSEAPTATPVS
jgi:hypothetical protein